MRRLHPIPPGYTLHRTMQRATVVLIGILALVVCAIVSASLMGCAEPIEVDQCMRAELFRECMRNLPAGPERTRYNDWDEVVDSCENASYYQSIRPRGASPSGCGLAESRP